MNEHGTYFIIIVDALRVCNRVELAQMHNRYNMRTVLVDGGVKITSAVVKARVTPDTLFVFIFVMMLNGRWSFTLSQCSLGFSSVSVERGLTTMYH